MKKIGFIFALLFVIACNNNVSREKELEKLAKEPPVVNYERDSVYYLIDVKGDEQKEEFLVTRQIMVNDLGIFSYRNEPRTRLSVQNLYKRKW